MDNIPRFAFYTSGVFIVSAAFTIFSSELLFLVADPSWKGTAALLAYGLVYMNIVFVISRRFMRRLDGPSPVPIIIGILVAIVPVIWIFIFQQAGLDNTQKVIYAVVMALGCGLGAHFGHRAGLKAQIEFKRKIEEYLRNTGQLPEDADQEEENLNKN